MTSSLTLSKLPKAQQFASAETYQRAIRLATKAWMLAMETGSEAALKASRKMFLLASQMKNARLGPVVYIQDVGVKGVPVLCNAGVGAGSIFMVWE